MKTEIKKFGNREYLVTSDIDQIEKLKKGDKVFFDLNATPMYHGSLDNAKDLLTVKYVSKDTIIFKEDEGFGAWDFNYRKHEMYKVVN